MKKAIFLLSILILVLANLFYFKSTDSVIDLTQSFANWGQWISGIMSLIVYPVLAYTLYEQQKQITLIEKSNNENLIFNQYNMYSKAIDRGLTAITNKQNNISGSAALIKYAGLKLAGTMSTKKIVDELSVDALRTLTASLIAFLEWICKDDERVEFYEFYRIQYITMINALVNILEPADFLLDKSILLNVYSKDNDMLMFILSVKKLHSLDLEAWIKHDESHKIQI
ncbi:MAG: hypothetical protein V4654_08905 [Bdellovibrionota bacterium]